MKNLRILNSMKQEQKLKLILEKAVKNGWDDSVLFDHEDFNYDFDCLAGQVFIWAFNKEKAFGESSDHFVEPTLIFFRHDFCKAFWGDKKIGHNFVNNRDILLWQSHLQEMVLEEEPIDYLFKFV